MNTATKEDLVQPLDPGMRALLLPEVIAKIAMGAKSSVVGEEVVVTFEGDSVRLHPADHQVACKVAERVRSKVPQVTRRSHVISCVVYSQQFLAEETFRPSAVRVLYFATMSKASAFYRCLMPRHALNQGTKCVAHATAAQYGRTALEYDIVVVQIDSSPATQQFAKQLQEMGKKVIYELDDAFDCLEEWHPNYTAYGEPKRLEHMYQMMGLADAVQVSTPWLAHRYRRYAKRIEVVPNMIELAAWPQADQLRQDGLFKVLWAGSPSHSGDLKEVVPALAAFARAHENVRIVLFGQEIKNSEIPEAQLENIPWCEFEEYPFRLAAIDADVAIAPLADVPFNYGKSNLRILQMWAAGYPVVASEVGPYAESISEVKRNGFFAKGTDQWQNRLELLYQNAPMRAAMIAAGREAVKEFDIRPNVEKIEQFYSSVWSER